MLFETTGMKWAAPAAGGRNNKGYLHQFYGLYSTTLGYEVYRKNYWKTTRWVCYN
jgi:hypothetical protein